MCGRFTLFESEGMMEFTVRRRTNGLPYNEKVIPAIRRI